MEAAPAAGPPGPEQDASDAEEGLTRAVEMALKEASNVPDDWLDTYADGNDYQQAAIVTSVATPLWVHMYPNNAKQAEAPRFGYEEVWQKVKSIANEYEREVVDHNMQLFEDAVNATPAMDRNAPAPFFLSPFGLR